MVSLLPIPLKQTQLSSGLTIAAACLPHLHTVSIVVDVRAGGRYETPETNGISHFVEHMLFRGNHNLGDAISLQRAASRLGGTLEARTTSVAVSFQITVAPDRLEAALAFLGTFFALPCFHDIEVERDVVLAEMEGSLDSNGEPWDRRRRVRQLRFGDHPLGLLTIGRRENVSAFTSDDVWQHFSTHYTGTNIVVGIAGPHDVDAMLAAAEHHIDVFERGNLIQSARYVPGQGHPMARIGWPTIRHLPSNHGDVGMFVTFAAVPDTLEYELALEALKRVVGGGVESLLFTELSQRHGLVYTINTELARFWDVHLLDTVAVVHPDRFVNALWRVLATLAMVRREGVDEELLDIVKAQYRTELLTLYDTPRRLATWAASHVGCDRPQPASYDAIMNGFTPDTLRDAAQRLMVAPHTMICSAGALDAEVARQLGWSVGGWVRDEFQLPAIRDAPERDQPTGAG